ncbi:MAG: Cobalamin-independent synthase, N-terminal domain, partial [Chloroflexota bacterium]|nr:Cobalamin-independent synthase, N-terminal domain [Chloroflexota bacterium]
DDELAARLDAVAALAAVGLDLVSDGDGAVAPNVEPAVVAGRWSAVAETSDAAVKQALVGPYSAGRRTGRDPAPLAESLRATILALAAAGCPIVEIDEADALAIAADDGERAAFVDAHRRLLDGVDGVHVTLALTGGNLDSAGPATFFDLPYASFAFDLIAGPDNWRLITQAPADRGIICGALDPRRGSDDTRETLVWAAHYAASANGRGLARVGLANASPLVSAAGLSRDAALAKLRIVAEATRIASVESATEMAGLLDPRAVDARSAALGRYEPGRRRRT